VPNAATSVAAVFIVFLLRAEVAQAADFSAKKGVIEAPGESMQRAFTVQV
jgi:hypothetical protein